MLSWVFFAITRTVPGSLPASKSLRASPASTRERKLTAAVIFSSIKWLIRRDFLGDPQTYPAFQSTGVIAIGTACYALMVPMQPPVVSKPRGLGAF